MKKLFAAAAVLALVLAGCAKQTTKDPVTSNPYNYVFSTDIATLDYVFTQRTTNSEHLANFVDGLLENDRLGKYVPALAESWEQNEDATVWTFKIRKGAKWVTSEGEEYADVTAHDFVTGAQHAIDFESETGYLIQYSIQGLDDYANGKIPFDQVGVKAVDDYTLEYTLSTPEPYFYSKTTYGILFPINKAFLESKGAGCKLGAPDPNDCTFGQPTPDSILYNGGYILTNLTSKSVIEYTKNEKYWDAEHVYVPSVKLVYYDGSDPDSLLRGFEAGDYSMARVFTNNKAAYDAAKAKYADSLRTSLTDATMFNLAFNFDRQTYDITNKNDKQKADTKAALLNKNFRFAIMMAFDVPAYKAISSGEDVKNISITNSLTAYSFTTVDGKEYGKVVEEEVLKQTDAFGSSINLKPGQPAFFNPAKAKELMAKARQELEAQGVTFPIHLDHLTFDTSAIGVQQQQSMKNFLEANLGTDNIILDAQVTDKQTYYNKTYYVSLGQDSDWDISTASGWGPDYMDPKTYLDIYRPAHGDMLHAVGLNPEGEENDSSAAKTAIGLYDYEALCAAADAITNDQDARMAAWAKADAWLLANAFTLPLQSNGGNPIVGKAKPYTRPFSTAGISEYKYKGLIVGDEIVTIKEADEARAAWEAERAK